MRTVDKIPERMIAKCYSGKYLYSFDDEEDCIVWTHELERIRIYYSSWQKSVIVTHNAKLNWSNWWVRVNYKQINIHNSNGPQIAEDFISKIIDYWKFK